MRGALVTSRRRHADVGILSESMMTETFSNELTTIHYADVMDGLEKVRDESVDLIFADPPYNIGKKFGDFKDVWPSDAAYVEWCYGWLEASLRKLKKTGSLYVMTSTQAMPYLDLWLREKVTILSRIMWHYDSSGVQAKKFYGSMYEPILFGVKDSRAYTFNAADIEVEAKTGSVRKLMDYRKEIPTPYKSTKVPGNAWYIPRVRYRMPEYEEHPSQKPETLLERVIKASSNPGDVILDPFAGSFTTCAVAQRLGRSSIGIEMNPEYIKIGLRRTGIAQTWNGETLNAIQKSTVRKNANGIRGGAVKAI